ncbi:hypothetical protein AB0I84_06230, partial [Streptomyces spectabilis]|uniref:hypothetical protein n=1 Tax=Streptomyces spectabilis TaxID=68270 RepID=UPI00340A69B9
TYLALTFGTLLSSQGTDASFVLTLSGFPPGAFPSVFRVSDSIRLFPASRSVPISSVLSGLSAFRRFRLYQVFSVLLTTIIRRHTEPDPALGSDLKEAAGPGR